MVRISTDFGVDIFSKIADKKGEDLGRSSADSDIAIGEGLLAAVAVQRQITESSKFQVRLRMKLFAYSD
ncbi:unnamed protein product [Citrullus colocynthis]|uniref:Uncharacterized protein n=1 Tax=Citrullus colocynthis TaxID=252529 RepID=A0ABP0Y230_9ROSI